LPYETAASAKATPPRSPENHMTNIEPPLMGGFEACSPLRKQRLVPHEPT
jgi:hypothetical protein